MPLPAKINMTVAECSAAKRIHILNRNVIGLIMKFEIEKKKLKFVNLCLYALVYRIPQAQTKSAVDKKN